MSYTPYQSYQNVLLNDSVSQSIYAFPAGLLHTSDEPRQLFYDSFDTSIDSASMWTPPTTSGSATTASVANGILSMATSANARAWSLIFSSASFKPTVPSWIGYNFAIALPDGAAVNANTYRFWGAGNIQTLPSTTAPMMDAVGFEITGSKMYAVVYNSGSRFQIQDLSATGNNKQPLDVNIHSYFVYIRTDISYWYIDALSIPVASSSATQCTAIQTLPITLFAAAGATAPSNTFISCSSLAVWDTGKNNTTISDGQFPWRKASITQKGSQGLYGFNTQDLKDTGRNQVSYFMTSAVLTSATDTLMTLTGFKGNAFVAPTTTPATVSAGKTYRIKSIVLTYFASSSIGSARFSFRVNPTGSVAVTSTVFYTYFVGAYAAVSGSTGIVTTVAVPIPDGTEFTSGSGIGVSMQGFNSAQAAAIAGWGQVNIDGFEY